ncbi:MAG: peptide-binding protein, partial [Actinomycetota bacterium]
GSETPPTVETMEGAPSAAHGERREIPVPHPGERPGAVRADHAPAPSPPEPQPSSGVAVKEAEPDPED